MNTGTNKDWMPPWTMRNMRLLLWAAVFGLVLAWPASGEVINFTFKKIIDTKTPIPGVSGNFTGFFVPSLDSGRVAFYGKRSGQGGGIYTIIGDTLTKVADTNTPIPGGSGNFTRFDPLPSLDGGKVAFSGRGSSGQVGIYMYVGGSLTVVADTNTPIPGGSGNFAGFGPPFLDGGNVVFRGGGGSWEQIGRGSWEQMGIYANIEGTLAKVADTNTPIPGGTGSFTSFGRGPSLDGGNVVFEGGGSSEQAGIYADVGGSLRVVADTNTPIPGGSGNFTGFAPFPSLDGGNVVFMGEGSSRQRGIYMYVGGSLTVVADKNTPIPGGTGNFTGLFSPSLDGGTVVFEGRGSSEQEGIYADIGGSLRVVADTSTPIPGGSGNFTSFHGSSLEGGNVAFQGEGSLRSMQEGIYTYVGGSLRVMADTSTPIPGGTASFTSFGRHPSLDGINVAFIGFVSNQEGIYTIIEGTLTKVADTNTLIPGGTGKFTEFYSPSLDGGKVAFSGRGSSEQEGIYTYVGGSLRVVADTSTPIPGGSGNFADFFSPSLDGRTVAFSGRGSSGPLGIYMYVGGSLTVVADTSTPIPGGSGNFTGFGSLPSLDGGKVAFIGYGSGQKGIYTDVGGSLSVVIDTNTPIPGGSGNFGGFNSLSFADGNVAFFEMGPFKFGIYTDVGGSLSAVADSNTPVPGGTGAFTMFTSSLSLNSGNVAFFGGGRESSGIYAKIGGTLRDVIIEGGFLDDKHVSYLSLGWEGLSGDSMVFKAEFSDSSEGIYRVIAHTAAGD